MEGALLLPLGDGALSLLLTTRRRSTRSIRSITLDPLDAPPLDRPRFRAIHRRPFRLDLLDVGHVSSETPDSKRGSVSSRNGSTGSGAFLLTGSTRPTPEQPPTKCE